MAVTALHAAASGMKAMDTKINVIANNLANTNTTAFKGMRVNFEDLFYEERRQPGALNSLGERTSTGLFVGLGTRESNTQLDMQGGPLLTTGVETDLAIRGLGFFKLKTYDGIGNGTAYTRAGNFICNSEGNLVLATTDGPMLDPPITIPEGYESITILSDGQVTVLVDGELQDAGQIELAKFPNPQGLRMEGGNMMTETDGSGSPITGNPADVGFGTLAQNTLEGSNVSAVTELVEMIRTQRAFELNSQTIQAVDENMQVVARLRR